MVLIYTGNEQLDKDLNKKIHNSRIPATKVLVNLRGNNPLLLDKMIYKKHELSKKLKDDPITNYNPIWTKNKQEKVIEKKQENTTKEEPIKNSEKGWDKV